MKLEYRKLSNGHPNVPEAEALFLSSFEENDRPPLPDLLSWDDDFYAIYEEGVFVALADVVPYEDLAYVFFLAVEEKQRGRGIGSKILEDLRLAYPNHRFFLAADECDPSYKDYEVRRKRFAFYHRNGFEPTGVFMVERGTKYELLAHDGPVTLKEFLLLMKHLLGDSLTTVYYGDSQLEVLKS